MIASGEDALGIRVVFRETFESFPNTNESFYYALKVTEEEEIPGKFPTESLGDLIIRKQNFQTQKFSVIKVFENEAWDKVQIMKAKS